METEFGQISLDRMVQAVERVRQRLIRASAALDGAGIAYAVIGGNAVAAWVSQVDLAAVRNTQDVDILLLRADLPGAIGALEAAGFVYRHVAGVDLFLDGEHAKARDAVHVVFAGEHVRPEYAAAAPNIAEGVAGPSFRVLGLDALVRMKLTSYRLKDRVHLQDLLGVGLIDASWLPRFDGEHASRFREVLANPEG